MSKWKSLQVKSASALEQEIVIPEVRIRETQSHTTHLVRGERPIIYYVENSESPQLTIFMISHCLGELFEVPSLKNDIGHILSTPEHQLLDDSFWRSRNIGPLPKAWADIFETHGFPPHIDALQIPQAKSSTELEMTTEEAHSIMRFIDKLDQSSIETPPISAEDDDLESLEFITNNRMHLLKRHPLYQTITRHEEYEKKGAEMTPGFAGEFFVPFFLMSLILDISETPSGSSWIFNGKLDQLPQTICRICTLRRRNI
jgi:hypothetical protein